MYFAAFKNKIGFYPPVKDNASLENAISPYAGEKGNLRFPLDHPIPYRLIERIVKHRVKQNSGEGGSHENQDTMMRLDREASSDPRRQILQHFPR